MTLTDIFALGLIVLAFVAVGCACVYVGAVFGRAQRDDRER